jgi:FAD/FMN-containing dehydrogenase
LALTWRAALRLVERFRGTSVHATVGRGVVRCIIPQAAIDAATLDVHAESHEAHPLVHALGTRPRTPGRVFERLPGPLWKLLAPSPANDRLSRGVRSAYDPHRILNPGILGDSQD